ncbi:Aldo/keto reductase [Metschnikowia bicuspidata]|uniref:Aldo/keto reductase n=1 Tax=Metschnikowia bicuspidata TaxID=27322 RepID=A0A4V1J2X0_9ASCO|nr:Aldo/keto reductase [Metschnikowia bicuspidata]
MAISNEAEVGQGIKDSGIPREQIFKVEKALLDSLRKLKLDYVDLYLMHWPYAVDKATGKRVESIDFVNMYKDMQKLLKLLADPEVTVKPVVNQIELHPLLPQDELVKWLKDRDGQVEAYCPLGSLKAGLLYNKIICKIAEKYGATADQILISWGVQRGTIVLPKSVTESRISNLKTVVLSDEDFKELNELHKKEGIRRVLAPSWNDFDD